MMDNYKTLLLIVTLLLLIFGIKYLIINLTSLKDTLEKLEQGNHQNINYFMNYYIDKNYDRQKEIDKCLSNNINNRYINNIYIIGTRKDISSLQYIKDKRVHFVINNYRPTFSYFFKIINAFTKDNDINILANSDIYFDESIKQLPNYLKDNNVSLALSRWDILPNSEPKHYDVDYSQDTWIFKGKIKYENIGNYYLGTWACDNRILQELLDVGYIVKNPSKTIKTYHLHLSDIKSYDKKSYVKGKYAYIKPTYD